jgi:hypothetical protein
VYGAEVRAIERSLADLIAGAAGEEQDSRNERRGDEETRRRGEGERGRWTARAKY